MFGLGAGEIFLILVFALIFIGPKKLPELAQSLGKSLREFQKAKDDLMAQVHEEANEIKKNVTSTESETPKEVANTISVDSESEEGPEENFEEFDNADHSDADMATSQNDEGMQEDHHSALTSDEPMIAEVVEEKDNTEKKDI